MMDAVGRLLIDGKSPFSLYFVVFKWENKACSQELQSLSMLNSDVSRTKLTLCPFGK